MENEKQLEKSTRRFLEVESEIAKKVQIFCFIRNITMKKFVTQAIQKELQPYEHWLENIKKLRSGKAQ